MNEQLLKKQFGYDTFRGEQKIIIENWQAGHSSLILMPTGMGKSLCYQFPAALTKNLVLVISPLIALMHDQVEKARGHGLAATYLSATLTKEEREKRLSSVEAGKVRLLFVTPERFRKPEFLQAIAKLKIDLLAIDEAHCISQWGHDFRPDYSRLGDIRKSLGEPVTMALTATATPEVKKDILKQLFPGDDSIATFESGIERPNLALRIHEVYGIDEKIRNLVAIRHMVQGPGIIYFSLIQTLEKVAREILRLGFEFVVYHGQMHPQDRKRSQNQFIRGDKNLVLATPAFGLGVDKPDIRSVTHFEFPGSIEAYYQEFGRAGRDGRPSECHFLFDEEDAATQMDFIKWANPDPGFIRTVFRIIKERNLQVQSEGADFIREQMNFYNRRDFRVESAIAQLERWGALEEDKSKFGYAVVAEPEGEFLEEKLYQARVKSQNMKLLELIRLLKLEDGCRMSQVYDYFGHKEVAPCGVCDLCLKP
ncbi:MAG: ATP-dependent DNA helicase RecQ [Pseudobdellovibrionaceae bacterium]